MAFNTTLWDLLGQQTLICAPFFKLTVRNFSPRRSKFIASRKQTPRFNSQQLPRVTFFIIGFFAHYLAKTGDKGPAFSKSLIDSRRHPSLEDKQSRKFVVCSPDELAMHDGEIECKYRRALVSVNLLSLLRAQQISAAFLQLVTLSSLFRQNNVRSREIKSGMLTAQLFPPDCLRKSLGYNLLSGLLSHIFYSFQSDVSTAAYQRKCNMQIGRSGLPYLPGSFSIRLPFVYIW